VGFKTGGSDLKRGRIGTLGSDPLDPDLVARIEGVHDLILTASSGSDGSGQLGERGGGAITPATNPPVARVGVRRTSP
jgi:hypothetical protein